jgi:hypothetical protein
MTGLRSLFGRSLLNFQGGREFKFPQAYSCGQKNCRLEMLFAAAHESVSGTKRTSSDVRNSDAVGGKPDMSLNADFGRE